MASHRAMAWRLLAVPHSDPCQKVYLDYRVLVPQLKRGPQKYRFLDLPQRVYRTRRVFQVLDRLQVCLGEESQQASRLPWSDIP
jgi:hypothetical protein